MLPKSGNKASNGWKQGLQYSLALSADTLAGNLEVEGLIVCHRDDEAYVAGIVEGKVDDVLGGLALACPSLVELVGIEGNVFVLGNQLIAVVGFKSWLFSS